MDYYTVLPATDLWGLTAGKFDHSGFCRGRSVTFAHMEVRSRAGGRLLSTSTVAQIEGELNAPDRAVGRRYMYVESQRFLPLLTHANELHVRQRARFPTPLHCGP